MKRKDEFKTYKSLENKRRIDREYQRRKRKMLKGYKTEEYREYRKKYPQKIEAQQKLNYAIQKGVIKRSKCKDCNSLRVHGHHPDYSKPLVVIWLCSIHHKNYH